MLSKSKISIIIPVFNEQTVISLCIERIRQCFKQNFEIIVVDGSPSKSTISVIKDEETISLQSKPGRSVQMNCGAQAASGEILLFIHADTILPKNAEELIREALEVPVATAGSFKLSFDDQSWTMKMIAFFADLRTRMERVPYGDQTLFIKKETFRKLGGFPEIPIMEDVEFFRNLKKRKLEILVLDESVITSSRRYNAYGPLRCAFRNCFLRLLHLCRISPEKIESMYRSRNN